MQSEFDVVIAGGGAMGSACAYFLHSSFNFRGSIMVVEPDPSYRAAASTRSASSIRRQFSSPINIALSSFGMQFLRDAPQRFSHTAVAADMGLVESSYLFLATSRDWPALERRVAIQQSAAVPVTLHDRAALAARYPWLNTADLAGGSDTASGEGWFDGHALLSALRGSNVRGGVRYVRDRVIGFEQSFDRRIVAARLQERRPHRLPLRREHHRHALPRAGCERRNRSAGVRTQAHVFVFTCPMRFPRCPFVIDPSGLWFRPERDRFLCGPAADPDPDVSPDDFDVDPALFESRAWPILAHRVPAFEAVRMTLRLGGTL